MASTDKLELTAIIHTCNSAAVLERALLSLSWVPERLVVDMASTDATLAIAGRLATRVLHADPAPRVDGIRNRYIEEAGNNWVLVIDSDEWLAADAGDEIARLIHEQGDRFDAFAIPRFNYVGEQLLRGGLWYPDNQVRLFRKGTVAWSDNHHGSPQVSGNRLLELTPPDCLHIHHQNYADLRDVIERQLQYSLTERFDQDAHTFSFADYIAEAHRCLALRSDPERDGDLSQALALIMAWDVLMRGLIHWDGLQPRPALDFQAVLPPASRDVDGWRLAIKKWTGSRYPLLFHLRRVRRRLNSIFDRVKRLFHRLEG
jgi:glycosyltransferase involved in cell wall biosynthesis